MCVIQEEILRVFAPKPTGKMDPGFFIEVCGLDTTVISNIERPPSHHILQTADRTYFCKTNSEITTKLWVAAISVFPQKFHGQR